MRWAPDGIKRLFAMSRRVCRRAAAGIEKDANLARKVSSKERIYAACVLAATDPRHATAVQDFDAQIWVLNTPGGILDLLTGQLRPHDRAALLTKLAAAGPEGECPRFRQFLREATGRDAALEKYLQRVAGYCATGSVQEEAFFFLFGPANTGKSKFQEILAYMLGDYATTAPMDTFLVATGERHPTELAAFHGRRMVIAAETEEGRRFDEAKLKAITGGDEISARFMRGDFFVFKPQFKLLLAGNYRPRLRSADEAMRRRLHMIPFDHKPATIDPRLIDKLKAEAGGILKWIAEGAVEWQQLGLRPPPAVVKATDEYFTNENTIGRWSDERCTRGPNEIEPFAALYRDYRGWAEGEGETVLSKRVFSEKLERLSRVVKTRMPTRTHEKAFGGLALRRPQRELPMTSRAPEVVQVPDWPGSEVGDPAEDWPRE